MRVDFNNNEISIQELNFKYSYTESDPKELFKLLRLLVDSEDNLELGLNSEESIARKFYEIISNEFGSPFSDL